MSHGPPVRLGRDAASAYKARTGLILFAIYGLVYAGFIVVNVLSPETMSKIVLFDLNLAVVYGFGLILMAVVLGVLYNFLCTRAEDRAGVTEPHHTGDRKG